MIVAGQRLPILIATKPVDFRCGHQALALIVQTWLGRVIGSFRSR